jgi:hypothetical protein
LPTLPDHLRATDAAIRMSTGDSVRTFTPGLVVRICGHNKILSSASTAGVGNIGFHLPVAVVSTA